MNIQDKVEFISFQDYVARMYPEFSGLNKNENIYLPVKNFTFQVTDDCNLACSYCYQINKGKRHMSFETAKLAVDKLLSGEDGFNKYLDQASGIILEFIGGEPFLEVELIDKIVDYFRTKAIELRHPWSNLFRISISTNGVLYNTEEVQKFLLKNKDVMSLSITVDGTRELHDACRVFPDGSPSYELAHAAALDWMSRGYALGSKITISPENIMYLSDCLLMMIYDGYSSIHANCVYEKGWNIEHAKTLYTQCKQFADIFCREYDNSNYDISLFADIYGTPKAIDDVVNWCGGTGLMLAMDPDGKIYPCLRYMESSLGNSREPLIIGDVWNGIGAKKCEQDCIDCIKQVNRRSQSVDQCFYCPVANGCSWCSAYNYQETGSVNKRVTYICEMHKARILANVYYWNSYHKKLNDGEVMDLWVPRKWAIPIIGEDEYDMLVKLTRELGGYVNEDATMVKIAKPINKIPREEYKDIEVLSRD